MSEDYKEEPELQDFSKTNVRAFELPKLEENEFVDLFHEILLNPNQGAGIDVSGASGSGKSNLMEWSALESLKLGVPILVIDPHGDSARRICRNLQSLPKRIRDKVIYLEPGSSSSIAGINPLGRPPYASTLTEYQLQCHRAMQIELVANILLAAVGEAGSGFGFRPVLRKWIVRWLTILYDSGLTLPCALMLLDPNHPIYRQLLKIVHDDMTHFQMSSLSEMKASDQEAEIGSARNRFLALLSHPATRAFFSRAQPTLDFQSIYEDDISLIVNLDKGKTLTDEFQKLAANSILASYVQTIYSVPESLRKRRFCMLDELPIFVESCAPLLEKCCTEIRKYRTSFLFCHQGANRFPDRTENPFFLTMLDMCRTKVFFRHGIDRKFFGELVATAAGSEPVVKHLQVNEQQFQDGYKILNLVDESFGQDTSEGQTNTESTSTSNESGTSITETLRSAVQSVRERSNSQSTSTGSNRQSSRASQLTTSRRHSITHKQTAVANMVTKKVVTSVQFYTPEERNLGAIDMVASLATGEAIIFVDGQIPPLLVDTPYSGDAYSHALKIGDKKYAAFIEENEQLPEFESPIVILREHEGFIQELLEELCQLPFRSNDSVAVPRKRIRSPLPEPERGDDLGL